jgi:phosphonoacetaldehyde hydrolase
MGDEAAFAYSHTYRGPVQAVIFDWAGTICDFGSLAPAEVFVATFARHGVAISLAEARGPMGTEKRAHIQALLEMPAVRERFLRGHDRPPGESDVDALYADFVPMQLEVLERFAELVPGTLETVAALRARGIRIGSNTGYSSDMTAINLAAAARQGLVPDSTVSADQVPRGRPAPAMCLANAIELGAGCVQACVKVDDTIPGIEEGLNAGMWTVGVAVSGNEVGLSRAAWEALDDAARGPLRQRARHRLAQAGAHYVVDTVAELVPCIDAIVARLARGERP